MLYTATKSILYKIHAHITYMAYFFKKVYMNTTNTVHLFEYMYTNYLVHLFEEVHVRYLHGTFIPRKTSILLANYFKDKKVHTVYTI